MSPYQRERLTGERGAEIEPVFQAEDQQDTLEDGRAQSPSPDLNALGSRSVSGIMGIMVAVGALGSIGVWWAAGDRPPFASEHTRILAGPGNSSNASECGTSLCNLMSWNGWQSADQQMRWVRSWAGWEVLPVVDSSTTTTSTTSATVTTTTTTVTKTSASTSTSTSATTTTTPCMFPGEDDKCYKEVLKAMYDIRDNPENYDGLSVWSSFEEVQDYLHHQRKSSCRLSCECESALIGSPCHEQVMHAMRTGIHEHPELYPDLDRESSFEDIQAYLWEHSNDTECTRPCRAPWRGTPSLFCWSVARKESYEADIVKAQLEAGAGIFLCDGYAILCEQDWTVGKGPGKRVGTVKAVIFEGASVGISKDNTAANALLFMNAWDAVISKTPISIFDWAVKVDPDAVVLPDRLRYHLLPRKCWMGFVRNCNRFPESSDFPMMYGALELVSRGALRAYAEGVDRCKNELDWHSWGEDLFLGKCLLHLGVAAIDDFSISSDATCTRVDCTDASAAAFHPFKTKGEWMNCWNTLLEGQDGNAIPPPLP